MLHQERHIWEMRPVRDCALIAACALLLWYAYRIRGILMPVFVGLLLAYIVEPAVHSFQDRWKVSRALTAAIMLATGVAVTVLVALWVMPVLFHQGYALLKNFPAYLTSILRAFSPWFGPPPEEYLAKFQPDPMMLLKVIGGFIGAATAAVFWLFLLPFFFFIFSWKFPMVVRTMRSLVPPRHKDKTLQITRRIDREFGNFFRARLLVGVTSGVLMAVGWLITGVPYWFLLGIIAGMLGIVPYLSVIAWVAAILFKSFTAGAAFSVAGDLFWPSLAFWIVHTLEEWVLLPWIQSYSVNLSAATIIIAILIGGELAGVWGLLFAIPAASAVKIIAEETFLPKLSKYYS